MTVKFIVSLHYSTNKEEIYKLDIQDFVEEYNLFV